MIVKNNQILRKVRLRQTGWPNPSSWDTFGLMYEPTKHKVHYLKNYCNTKLSIITCYNYEVVYTEILLLILMQILTKVLSNRHKDIENKDTEKFLPIFQGPNSLTNGAHIKSVLHGLYKSPFKH